MKAVFGFFFNVVTKWLFLLASERNESLLHCGVAAFRQSG